MINGAHMIIYTKDADADRAFFRDVLKFPHVDVGDGWLIFALPPSEIALHPDRKNGTHAIYLMCEDVKAFMAEMKKRKIACAKVDTQPYGLMTAITLPGGGELGVYQPTHARPKMASRAR